MDQRLTKLDRPEEIGAEYFDPFDFDRFLDEIGRIRDYLRCFGLPRGVALVVTRNYNFVFVWKCPKPFIEICCMFLCRNCEH